MASIPELLKDLTTSVQTLNTTISNGFASMQKQTEASAQPDDRKPLEDKVDAMSSKVDTIVSQVSDTAHVAATPAAPANAAS